MHYQVLKFSKYQAKQKLCTFEVVSCTWQGYMLDLNNLFEQKLQ